MSILYLDFIHEQTLVFYIILSDSTATFSSLLAQKFLSRFIAIGERGVIELLPLRPEAETHKKTDVNANVFLT